MRPPSTESRKDFVVFAQLESFAAAAEHRCLSQSTISQHVRRLGSVRGGVF
jgi:DNA-binding transcriptional LysR family regulator